MRSALRRFTARWPLLAVVVIFLVGVLAWGAFNTSLEVTNTEAFCISCHEMEDYIYREYKKTVHFMNRTGVRATCPDCHVPKDWIHKVVRKVGATNELYHKLRGSIDTHEKFLDKRLRLARIVWTTMEDTDSRECRNCHAFDYMDLDTQKDRARIRHEASVKERKTCIDCHKGIAHKLPEEFVAAEHERFEREGVPCSDCHPGMTQAPAGDAWADD